jgi:hypothetical protein
MEINEARRLKELQTENSVTASADVKVRAANDPQLIARKIMAIRAA